MSGKNVVTLHSDVNSECKSVRNEQVEPKAMKSEALGAEAVSVEANNTHAKLNEECTIRNSDLKSHTNPQMISQIP